MEWVSDQGLDKQLEELASKTFAADSPVPLNEPPSFFKSALADFRNLLIDLVEGDYWHRQYM